MKLFDIDLDALERVCRLGGPVMSHILPYTCRSLGIIRNVQKRLIKPDTPPLEICIAEKGSIPLLDWAYRSGAVFSRKCMYKAANRGHLSTIQYILDPPKLEVSSTRLQRDTQQHPQGIYSSIVGALLPSWVNTELLDTAMTDNAPPLRVSVMQESSNSQKKHPLLVPSAITAAVLGGHEDVVRWLYLNGCSVSWKAAEAAAFKDDLHLLKILMNECDVNITDDVFAAAARKGSISCLGFLLSYSIVTRKTEIKITKAVCKYEKFDVLEWLHDFTDINFLEHSWREAMSSNNETGMLWLIERGTLPNCLSFCRRISFMSVTMVRKIIPLLERNEVCRGLDSTWGQVYSSGRTDMHAVLSELGYLRRDPLIIKNVNFEIVATWLRYTIDNDISCVSDDFEHWYIPVSLYATGRCGDAPMLTFSELQAIVRTFHKVRAFWEMVYNILNGSVRMAKSQIEKDKPLAFEIAYITSSPSVLMYCLAREPPLPLVTGMPGNTTQIIINAWQMTLDVVQENKAGDNPWKEDPGVHPAFGNRSLAQLAADHGCLRILTKLCVYGSEQEVRDVVVARIKKEGVDIGPTDNMPLLDLLSTYREVAIDA